MEISVAKVLASIVLAALMLVQPAQAIAAQTNPLSAAHAVLPLIHSSWLIKDGAPPGAIDIAQTPDGWIWVSSSAGLFRFDGVSFARYRPPAGQSMPVSSYRIGVLNDGTLWATARFGGLSFINGSKYRFFEAGKNNFPVGAMGAVLRDDTGRIWVASWDGLFSLAPGSSTWHNMNAELGLPGGPMNDDLLLDKKGTMWALGLKAIYARRKGEARFQKISERIGWGRLAQAPDGSVWSTDMGGKGVRKLWVERDDPKYDVLKQKEFNALNFIIDRAGNFWFPKNDGVVRVEFGKKAPSIQKYTSRQGLSGGIAKTVFEDREGNIWVLTDSGIDQFRPSRTRLLSRSAVLSQAQAVLAGPDGDLWIDHDYFRTLDSSPSPFAPRPVQKNMVTALYRDPRGIVWSATLEGIWKTEGNKRIYIPVPPEVKQNAELGVYSMAMDSDGGLWVNFEGKAWRLKDGVWQKNGGIRELQNFLAIAMAAGPHKSFWFGSFRQNILILQDGKVHELGHAQGMDIGAVIQIIPSEKGVYIGGENGLALFDGNRAIPIRGENDEIFPNISGLVIMPNGDVWAHSGVGLISISASEIAATLHNPGHLVRFQRFDENDGLIGTAPPLPSPSVVRTSSNDLVISTTSGTFRFNPANVMNDKASLPLEIVGVTAAGKAYGPSPGLTLDPAPDSVRIDYTALHFRFPQRVHFRYMLDGFDRQWQDAGTRRSAFYTKLPPGRYNFKVMAANEDGVWGATPATLAFSITPTFVQTMLFKLLCTLSVLALAALLYWRRMRSVTTRITERLRERLRERERIARALHDNFLQSVQALMMQFNLIKCSLPDNHPVRTNIDRALETADDVLSEGREQVLALRLNHELTGDLEAALSGLGHILGPRYGAHFVLLETGERRPLRAAAAAEAYAIGREALLNALRHSGSAEVTLELRHTRSQFSLQVRDAGCGLNADVYLRGQRPGHFGLAGMRERAQDIGGTLEIRSEAGKGTTVTLRLPARAAYARRAADKLPSIPS